MIVNGAPYRGYDLRLNAEGEVDVYFWGEYITTEDNFDDAKDTVDGYLAAD